jgi:hypothetical protein
MLLSSVTMLDAADAATHGPSSQTSSALSDELGLLSFELGMPTPSTVRHLYDTMDFQRAVLCYLWATPIIGMQAARQALIDNAGAKSGELVLVEGYRDVSVMLGSNVTTPYVLAHLDLSAGPLVMDYPPGATGGSLIDWWDRPIADIGVAGIDGGKGASFILIGPGQEVPPDLPAGAHVLRSRTHKALMFCRGLDAELSKVQTVFEAANVRAHGRQRERASTPLLRFRRTGELTSMAHPKGIAYWRMLADALRSEAVEDRDRFFAAMLKPLGIEGGRGFEPDSRQTGLLQKAALFGEATARVNAFNKRLPGMRYRGDASWEYLIPPSFSMQQDIPGGTLFEERTAFFYEVMGASEAVMTRKPGVGSGYLAAYHDKSGAPLDGGKTYRLVVPPIVPAKLFWSLTLYDTDSRCLIQNAQQIVDRSSRHDMQKNGDGSIEIVMSPDSPRGFERNWIPTVPGRSWFAYFRLFGPLEPYFERSWRLQDIEVRTA